MLKLWINNMVIEHSIINNQWCNSRPTCSAVKTNGQSVCCGSTVRRTVVDPQTVILTLWSCLSHWQWVVFLPHHVMKAEVCFTVSVKQLVGGQMVCGSFISAEASMCAFQPQCYYWSIPSGQYKEYLLVC